MCSSTKAQLVVPTVFRNETSLFLIGSSMHIGIFLKWQTKQWVDDNIFIQA